MNQIITKNQYPRTLIRKLAGRMFWLSRQNETEFAKGYARGHFEAYKDADKLFNQR
jgi:hypothetical protein